MLMNSSEIDKCLDFKVIKLKIIDRHQNDELIGRFLRAHFFSFTSQRKFSVSKRKSFGSDVSWQKKKGLLNNL